MIPPFAVLSHASHVCTCYPYDYLSEILMCVVSGLELHIRCSQAKYFPANLLLSVRNPIDFLHFTATPSGDCRQLLRSVNTPAALQGGRYFVLPCISANVSNSTWSCAFTFFFAEQEAKPDIDAAMILAMPYERGLDLPLRRHP